MRNKKVQSFIRQLAEQNQAQRPKPKIKNIFEL